MPIQAAQYKIRHLRRHEIEQLLQLCKAEGRHMGTVAEIRSWMQIDPQGFFIAVTKQGQIIGSCCGMRLSPSHGYVGMYVVDKGFRGLGIGKEVWDAAIKHLGSRNNGLSAVAHLFTLYRDKAGFSHVADWTIDLWKLDNMAALFHCKQHHSHSRHAHHNGNLNNNLLLDFYRGGAICCQLGDQNMCDKNGTFGNMYEDECNFVCLMHRYNTNDRKFMKQRRVSKSIDAASDDESYGFSSLFFDDDEQSNDEISDLDDRSLEQMNGVAMATRGVDDVVVAAAAGVVEQVMPLDLVVHDLVTAEQAMSQCSVNIGHYCNSYNCANGGGGKMRTVRLNADDLKLVEKVVEYDQRINSYDRGKIVRLTLSELNCLTRVALLGDTVLGYGCVKPNLQNMWIVSPLYADSEYVARMLLYDLLTDLTYVRQYRCNPKMSSSIVLKSPSNNHRAAATLEGLGFVKQDYSLRRCYTKQLFEVPTQAIYALHTSVFCTE